MLTDSSDRENCPYKKMGKACINNNDVASMINNLTRSQCEEYCDARSDCLSFDYTRDNGDCALNGVTEPVNYDSYCQEDDLYIKTFCNSKDEKASNKKIEIPKVDEW